MAQIQSVGTERTKIKNTPRCDCCARSRWPLLRGVAKRTLPMLSIACPHPHTSFERDGDPSKQAQPDGGRATRGAAGQRPDRQARTPRPRRSRSRRRGGACAGARRVLCAALCAPARTAAGGGGGSGGGGRGGRAGRHGAVPPTAGRPGESGAAALRREIARAHQLRLALLRRRWAALAGAARGVWRSAACAAHTGAAPARSVAPGAAVAVRGSVAHGCGAAAAAGSVALGEAG